MQRLILFLIAVVLFGIAGFALIWFGAGRDLQGPSVAFLTHCRDGAFDEAYAAAHPDFQAARSVAQLEALWRHWESRYGVFGEVVRRIGVYEGEDAGPWSEALRLDLGFQDGHVLGTFYFATDAQGASRLVHVALAPRARVDVPASDRSRLEVKARKLFTWFDEAKWVDLYDALAPSLQMSWTQAAFMDEMPALRERLGAVQHVELATMQDVDGGVRQLFEVTCERGKAAFEVVHTHDDGAWHVAGFAAR